MRNALRVLLAMAMLVALLAVPAAASGGLDDPVYEENRRSFIGVAIGEDSLPFRYEIAVDQIRLRNGDSHKVWVVAPSTEALVSLTDDISGDLTVTCPWDDEGSGAFVFTRRDLPIRCDYTIGDRSGEFDVTKDRGKRPSPEALELAPTGDIPTITQDLTFSGSFEYPVEGAGNFGAVSVNADAVSFPDGPTGFYVPESNKKTVEGFAGKIRCEFDGPGVAAVGPDALIDCDWRIGNGPNRQTGEFELGLGTPLPLGVPTSFGDDGDGNPTVEVLVECTEEECPDLFVTFEEGIDEDSGKPFFAISKTPDDFPGVFLEIWTPDLSDLVSFLGFEYDDTLPFGDGDLRDLTTCKTDPRVMGDGGPEFAIDPDYIADPSLVLRDGETTCLFEFTGFVVGGDDPTIGLFSEDGFRRFK